MRFKNSSFKNRFPAATTVSTVRRKVVIIEDSAIIGYGWTYCDAVSSNPYNCEMFTNNHLPLPDGAYTVCETGIDQLVVIPFRVQ